MPTAEKTATSEETWRNWLQHITDALSRDDFIEGVNQEYGINLSAEQIQSWEDRGLLPRPLQDNRYPHNAEIIVRALQDFERERGGIPPGAEEITRGVLRAVAKAIDETARLDIRDQLTEMLQEEAARHETWVDWMPEGAPMPDLLSHDQLLDELRDRGTPLTSSSFQHYRQRGVLPRPIRRRYEGVTQAVYPSWFIPAIEHLRQLQEQGKSLDEIAPFMRAWAHN